MYEKYNDRTIEVLSIDDATSGEHIIEFRDPAQGGNNSVVAVFNRGDSWHDAKVSINPHIKDVPAEFLMWALEVSRQKMGYAS